MGLRITIRLVPYSLSQQQIYNNTRVCWTCADLASSSQCYADLSVVKTPKEQLLQLGSVCDSLAAYKVDCAMNITLFGDYATCPLQEVRGVVVSCVLYRFFMCECCVFALDVYVFMNLNQGSFHMIGGYFSLSDHMVS